MERDFTVYTSIETDVLKEKLDVLRKKYKGLLDGPYMIYNPDPILTRKQLEEIDDRVEKDLKEKKLLIVEKFGMHNAKSYFITSINEKTFTERGLEWFFREEFGERNIIAVFNGEIKI